MRPSTNATNDSWGGFGVTIVDGLDTAILMGLDEVIEAALVHVEGINFTARDWKASTFEYTIRYVGGLLGAQTLLGEASVLHRKVWLVFG